jgi:hypothetical protein
MLDQALHVLVGDIGVTPRIHGRRRSKNFADGGRARVGESSAGGRRAEVGVPKMEGKVSIL